MSDNGDKNATKEWTPTPKQRVVLDVAASGEKTSITAICKEAKVERQTIYKWFKDPDFMKAWNDTWIAPIERHLPSMTAAQIKKAEKGNTNAYAKLIEATGKMVRRVDLTSGGKEIRLIAVDNDKV